MLISRRPGVAWRRMLMAAWLCFVTGTSAWAQFDLENIDPFSGDSSEQPTPPPEADLEAQAQPQTAEDVYNQGKALADEGRCAEAIELFSQILAVSPNYVPAALERGKCLAEIGENQLALESLGQAVNYGVRYPAQYAEALSARGNVLMELGLYQEAVDDFSLAVQSKPADPEFLYLRGKALIRLAQAPSAMGFNANMGEYYSQAISSLTRAIDIRTDYAEAYSERGNAYSALGDYENAIDDFEQAVALDKETSRLKAQLGFTMLRRADTEKRKHDADLQLVMADYQNAIRTFTDYLAVEGQKSKEDFEDVDPEFVMPDQVYLGRAIAQISLGNESSGAGQRELLESAISDAEKVLEFDDSAVTAYYHKGVAQRLIGDYAAALQTFTNALEVSPTFSEAQLRRGIVFYYLGDTASARGDFEQVIRLNENPDGRAQFWVGATYSQEGNYQDAIRMYTKTLRINPEYKPAYNNRGLAYLQLGDYERAARDFEELYRRDYRDTVARQRRDLARKMMAQKR